MADRDVDVLIVGAGAAGAACAEALVRDRSFDGSVLLVGREADPPYERPPASKDYLRGETERVGTYLHPAEWYGEKGVELLTRTSVMKLDTAAKVAKLSSKEEVGYGACVLATGANVRRLRVPGAQLEGIHYLRALGNADAIRADAEDASHVVLVGGSYIACEVAASLTAIGKRCTMVMMEEVALSGGFGTDVGRWFHELLESKGVEVLGGQTLEAFVGDERVEKVLTDGGREIECDAVVVGAGVHPDTMLAQRAGLDVDDGIVCDSGLETSAGGIFAAGDCASFDSEIHGRRLRVEHWDVAMQQGMHAARGMLGDKQPYRVVPYFFSDLADWAGLEYVGPAASWAEVIWRGDREGGEFSVWYVADDRVVAALSVGRPEDLSEARRMVESGVALGEGKSKLSDLEADLAGIG